MSNSEDLTWSHVTERDIDLALVEELQCSAVVQRLFLAVLSGAARGLSASKIRLRHSVSRSGPGSGETDIELLADFVVNGSPYRALMHIEDKIHSPFTPDQARGYLLHGQEVKARHECDEFASVLVAPKGYLATHDCILFAAVISYEQILETLRKRAAGESGETAMRTRHRCQMIEQAIVRQRRGYVAVPDPAVSTLWGYYARLANERYPQLRLICDDSKKPGDSYTASFDCLPPVDSLPKCRIEHLMQPAKRSQGYVHILMPGKGTCVPEFRANLGSILPAHSTIIAAGKSAAIRIDVPMLNRFMPAAQQQDTILKALAVAEVLRRWWLSHAREI